MSLGSEASQVFMEATVAQHRNDGWNPDASGAWTQTPQAPDTLRLRDAALQPGLQQQNYLVGSGWGGTQAAAPSSGESALVRLEQTGLTQAPAVQHTPSRGITVVTVDGGRASFEQTMHPVLGNRVPDRDLGASLVQTSAVDSGKDANMQTHVNGFVGMANVSPGTGVVAVQESARVEDASVQNGAVPKQYQLDGSGQPMSSDAISQRVGDFAGQGPRVSNNKQVYWGESLGSGVRLENVFADSNYRYDDSPFIACHTAKEQSYMENFAKSKPSTYGLGAEFRNFYLPVVDNSCHDVNVETARIVTDPDLAAHKQAGVQYYAKVNQANKARSSVMVATDVAYDSEVGQSDFEN